MAITIRNEDSMILFYDSDRSEPVYGMPHALVGNVRMEGDDFCSDWIMQLVDKDWCPTEKLYEFALIIRELGKDNEIDWYATFQIVERRRDLLDANELKNAANTPNGELKTSTFDELIELIRFNSEDDRNISQPIIDRIVQENLDKYNLN